MLARQVGAHLVVVIEPVDEAGFVGTSGGQGRIVDQRQHLSFGHLAPAGDAAHNLAVEAIRQLPHHLAVRLGHLRGRHGLDGALVLAGSGELGLYPELVEGAFVERHPEMQSVDEEEPLGSHVDPVAGEGEQVLLVARGFHPAGHGLVRVGGEALDDVPELRDLAVADAQATDLDEELGDVVVSGGPSEARIDLEDRQALVAHTRKGLLGRRLLGHPTAEGHHEGRALLGV